MASPLTGGLLVAAIAALVGCGMGGSDRPAPQPARSAGPVPDRTAPSGFHAFPDPQGTGRGLYGTFRGGVRSATQAVRGVATSLGGYFDRAPELHTAARDGADQRVQAFFSATMHGAPVEGVLAVN